MSDAVPPSEPVHPSPGAAPEGLDGSDAPEVELDVRAFLPDGVVLGDADADAEVDADGAEPTEVAAVEARAEAEEPEVEVEVEAADEVVPEAASDPTPDLAALDQVQADLDAVDAAIAALDAGTYGIDPATGEPIDDELLAADPTRLR